MATNARNSDPPASGPSLDDEAIKFFKWSPSYRKKRCYIERVPFKYVVDVHVHVQTPKFDGKKRRPGESVEDQVEDYHTTSTRSKRRRQLEVNVPVISSNDSIGINHTLESCSASDQCSNQGSIPSTREMQGEIVLWQPTLLRKRGQSDYSEFDCCLSVYNSVTNEIKKQSVNNNDIDYKHNCLVMRDTINFFKKT